MKFPVLTFPARHHVLAIVLVMNACAHAATSENQVVRWDFGVEESSPLLAHGGIERDVPGPRPPEFADFSAQNTAVKLDGAGAYFSFADGGAGSRLDFTNGDALTIEAWVKPEELASGACVYVVGKGRTGKLDNQNWALRLRGESGKACVSFLFATAATEGRGEQHWHRWTTEEGFMLGSGWHHVAVAYKFGDSRSMKGWLDGKPRAGRWDMGGATEEPPVVDDDAVWIGSARGGAVGNSFKGALDAVVLHREILSDDTMKTRFLRKETPPAKLAAEVMPEFTAAPGTVLLTFHEGLSAHNRWLNEEEAFPPETARFQSTHFLLPRLPLRYDDWGIRESWKPPTLARLQAEVSLPAGKNRFVIRTRGLSRLWLDGKIIARTPPPKGSTDGHNPVQRVVEPPLPGVRPVAYGQQEIFAEMELPGQGKFQLMLETILGTKDARAESGEITVAVATPDGKSFVVLQPAILATPVVPLTDLAVSEKLAEVEVALSAQDDAIRRNLAASQNGFWKRRHAAGRTWAQQHPAPAVPSGQGHPVDAFLQSKIDRALAASAEQDAEVARHFHNTVLPILQEQCFRCHGEKDKGGLRLNTRSDALLAGKSDQPAVVPGNAAASELMKRIQHPDREERMPPQGDGLTSAQTEILATWIQSGAPWPAPPITLADVAQPAVVEDATWLRRVYFDTVGVPPTEVQAREFLSSETPDKRSQLVNRLLQDERWADHWVSYWQDVLAENPSMLKPSLNNTGPFRWFLHEALRDDKPLDRLVTELLLLRGSQREGGSDGFGYAADNDAPFAAKGQIVASAFLGIELQCARCHDSPYHSTKQRDLYALAAMFERKAVTVPKSSTVPAAFFEQKERESLIKVTLKPKESIAPIWPFAQITGCADDAALEALMQQPKDSRERLATLITAPQNQRFAQIIANRVWRRLMGAGIVEPPQDWEGHAASHPELLNWLAHEFVAHDYSVKHLTKIILTSQAYQRAATGQNLKATPALRFFNAPEQRRLSAEQIVDALYTASGQRMDTEEITFDPDGRNSAKIQINLGQPRRAWMFASLSNERDRPSLSLPRAQAVVDVLEAFGWTGSRQNPRTDRESDAHALQPEVLANSLVSTWITRAAYESELANLALHAASPETLVDSIFLRFLSRLPSPAERSPMVSSLSAGFAERNLSSAEVTFPEPLPRLPRITWSNHLMPDATTIQQAMEQRARQGAPPDPRLRAEWREVYEDVLWSVLNTREFVWLQ